MVAPKSGAGKRILHSSHIDLEPTGAAGEIERVIKECGFDYKFTDNIESAKNPLKKNLKMYQDCDYVVTTRLHGAIIAYAFNRPYIAISFDPKIAAFNKLYGGGVCITELSQLPTALRSDQFKVSRDYKAELAKIKQFGAQIKAAVTR